MVDAQPSDLANFAGSLHSGSMEAMSAEGDREQQLLAAAEDLIRDGRTLNLSLGEVADRVGVSRSLLYVYFDGVPAIIDALFLQHMERLAARILPELTSEDAPYRDRACAAYAACRTLGFAPKVIEAAFHSFGGLPHRSQTIGERDGVRFVNDSKATNVDSAVKALAAFESIRWICGGLEKEGGVGVLAGPISTVRKAYVIGREAAQFAMKLGVEAEVCGTMEKAVARAVAEAEPGDVVLLAPAAASFDQYDNFERRGEDFVVQARKHL